MPRTKKTTAINIPSNVTDGMINDLLEASVNVADSTNTHEHTAAAGPVPNPETGQTNIDQTDVTGHSTENPIPTKSAEWTIRKRQKRAMISIINKDHGK